MRRKTRAVQPEDAAAVAAGSKGTGRSRRPAGDLGGRRQREKAGSSSKASAGASRGKKKTGDHGSLIPAAAEDEKKEELTQRSLGIGDEFVLSGMADPCWNCRYWPEQNLQSLHFVSALGYHIHYDSTAPAWVLSKMDVVGSYPPLRQGWQHGVAMLPVDVNESRCNGSSGDTAVSDAADSGSRPSNESATETADETVSTVPRPRLRHRMPERFRAATQPSLPVERSTWKIKVGSGWKEQMLSIMVAKPEYISASKKAPLKKCVGDMATKRGDQAYRFWDDLVGQGETSKPGVAERNNYAALIGLPVDMAQEEAAQWQWLIEEAMNAPVPAGWREKYEPRCRATLFFPCSDVSDSSAIMVRGNAESTIGGTGPPADRVASYKAQWQHPLLRYVSMVAFTFESSFAIDSKCTAARSAIACAPEQWGSFCRYYRALIIQLRFFSSKLQELQSCGNKQARELMQNRQDALCTAHVAGVKKLCKREDAAAKQIRLVRYSRHFRKQMEAQLHASIEDGKFPDSAAKFIFTGNSRQLATWRVIEAEHHAQAITAADGLVMETERTLSMRWLQIHEMELPQGKLLEMLAEAEASHAAAALIVQAFYRGVPARRRFHQAKIESRRRKMQQKARRTQLAAGMVKRWLHRGSCAALDRWRLWTVQRLHNKAKIALCAEKRFHGVFQSFQHRCHTQKIENRRLEKAKRMVLRMRKQTAAKCVDQWGTWARDRVDMRVAAAVALNRLMRKRLHEAYCTWQFWAAETHRKWKAAEAMLCRLQDDKVTTVFFFWYEFLNVQRSKRGKLDIATAMVLRIQRAGAAQCFRQWAEWARQMRTCKQLVQRMLHGCLLECFTMWCCFAEEQKKEADMVQTARKMVQRMMKAAFVRCFEKWAEWARQMRTCKQLVQRMLHGCMLECFVMWCCFVEEQKKEADMVQTARKMVQRMLHAQMVSCFEKWNRWAWTQVLASRLLHRIRQATALEVIDRWKHNMAYHQSCRADRAFQAEQFQADRTTRHMLLLLQRWRSWTLRRRHTREAAERKMRRAQERANAEMRKQARELGKKLNSLKDLQQKEKSWEGRVGSSASTPATVVVARVLSPGGRYHRKDVDGDSETSRAPHPSGISASIAAARSKVEGLEGLMDDISAVLHLQRKQQRVHAVTGSNPCRGPSLHEDDRGTTGEQDHVDASTNQTQPIRRNVVQQKSSAMPLHSLTGSPPKRASPALLTPIGSTDHAPPQH